MHSIRFVQTNSNLNVSNIEPVEPVEPRHPVVMENAVGRTVAFCALH